MGAFDNLIPGDKKSGGAFDDLIPSKGKAPPPIIGGSGMGAISPALEGAGKAGELGGFRPDQEAVLQMLTGAIAKPVSDVAGLAAGAKEMISPSPDGGDPAGFKREVQDRLTYAPRTPQGQMAAENNPMAIIGRLISSGAGKAGELIAPPESSGPGRTALGHGVTEALEQAPGFLGVGGTKALPKSIPKAEPVLDATRSAAQSAGYITPPEGGVKAALAGLAGKAKTEKTLSHLNEDNATKRFSEELTGGAPLSKEGLRDAKQEGYAAYQGMKDAVGPYLKPTGAFRDSISSTLADVRAKLKFDPETYKGLKGTEALLKSWLKKTEPRDVPPPGKEVPGIFRTIDKAVQETPQAPIGHTLERAAADSPHGYGSLTPAPTSPIPSLPSTTAFPTDLTLEAIKNLRQGAKDNYLAGDRELGQAKYGIANQLENMFEENLAQTGQQGLVDAFRDQRRKLAQIHFAEQVVNEATGKVDLGKVRSLSETKQYKGVLTGALKEAADFAKAFPKAAARVTGEPSPSLSVFDGMFAVSSIAAGHPWAAAAELGGRTLIPEAAKRGLLQHKGPGGSEQVPRDTKLPALLGLLLQGQLQPPPQ